MSNVSNNYRIYIEQTLQLASTMVVKSLASADGLNRRLTDYNPEARVDDLDPRSWKYYLNISGEYHWSDAPMRIVSMDTLKNITFSKEALMVHRATERGYAYGTRAYKELVNLYPEQEMLILGILYPADIEEAVAAKDGTILAYPRELIEPNEYSLRMRLQEFIYGYKARWTNNQYAITDQLYYAVNHAIMYLNLVPCILNLRLEACRTNEAHSFHVRQYLASHGLDLYVDRLTLTQQLFFYRNIAYIERNSGQTHVFEWLVEHVMTERNLPLAEFVMRHKLKDQPAALYPELGFRRKQINTGPRSAGPSDLSLTQILAKEERIARDNFAYNAAEQTLIQERMENSLSNVVLTKALESSTVDYTDTTPYTMTETLLSHWAYLAGNGLYGAFIGLTNPKTGERIPLTVKEAYVFMTYAYLASLGFKPVEIGKFYAKRVQQIPPPGVQALYAVVDTRVLPKSVIDEAYSYAPLIDQLSSTEAFYRKCQELNRAAQLQRKLIAKQESYQRRGMLHNAVSRIYVNAEFALTEPGQTYAQWFGARNVDVSVFERSDWELIHLNLTRDATGLSLTTTDSLKDLQNAMVKLLGQLSSYSVQFMTEINTSRIRVGDWPAIRFGKLAARIRARYRTADLNVGVLKIRGKLKIAYRYDLGKGHVTGTLGAQILHRMRYPIGVKPRLFGPSWTYLLKYDSARVRFRAVRPPVASTPGQIAVLGIELFEALTVPQQLLLHDMYTDRPLPVPQSLLYLDRVLTNLDLPGFDSVTLAF